MLKLYKVPIISEVDGRIWQIFVDPNKINNVYATKANLPNPEKNSDEKRQVAVTAFLSAEYAYLTTLTVKQLLTLLDITTVEPPTNV